MALDRIAPPVRERARAWALGADHLDRLSQDESRLAVLGILVRGDAQYLNHNKLTNAWRNPAAIAYVDQILEEATG